MASNITMLDIARRAGVSVATVSMSLRNKAQVSAATRAQIVAIAKELGYRPHPYLSALMHARRQRRVVSERPPIAVVCCLETPDGWRMSPGLTRQAIFHGVLDQAEKLGFHAQEYWLHMDGMSPKRFSRMLHTRGISGVVVGPPPYGEPIARLEWELFSAVAIGVPSPSVPVVTVCNDHYMSSLRVVRECHELGYRRPGLVLQHGHRKLFQGRWESGFSTGVADSPGMALLPVLYLDSQPNAQPVVTDEFPHWIEREKPDVVIAPDWKLLHDAMLRHGLRVPQDIGLATVSCPQIGHSVSGACQNGHLIGATAVDVLASRIDRQETGLPEQAITTMVESMWNPGTTLRNQRGGRRRSPSRAVA